MNSNEKIKFLSIDAAFGILTRPALEIEMSEQNGIANIYIIDFNDVHKLNKQLGYNNVNVIIRNSILKLKERYFGIIIGRVFSGDEIVIIDPAEHPHLIENFADLCKDDNLGYELPTR